MMSSEADLEAQRGRDEGARIAAPRYFVDDPDALHDGGLLIRGSTAGRLNRVMRARRDDDLEIIHPPSKRRYRLRVTRVTRESVEGEIRWSEPIEPPNPPRIMLCAALIRPQRFDFMVEKVTELGAAAIQPIRTERSLIRTEGSQRLARWRRLTTEASEQSGRETRPEVHTLLDFAELVEKPAPPDTLRILASAVEPELRMVDLLRGPPPLDVQILIGPEGGLTPLESRRARAQGWRSVTLGTRPLRAETAAIVAVALVVEGIAAHHRC